jgi:tRNA(fMet)-specific endonuclease VapC
MRGWLELIHKERDPLKRVPQYGRLQRFVNVIRDWRIIPFDERAAVEFTRQRRQRVRIGAKDLSIACIALTQGALLLSANLSDFRKVPGLRVEDWMRPTSPDGDVETTDWCRSAP